MAEKLGYIKSYRKILDGEGFKDINTCHFFIYCLHRANYETQNFMGEEIPRGSFVSSLKHMADETGLTVKQVRKCLEKLKNTQNVASKGTNKYTIVSVVNYELYQDEQTRKGQATGHSKGKQRATIKEYKEIKKYYNNTSKKSFDNFSKGVMTTDEMENMEELKEKYGG